MILVYGICRDSDAYGGLRLRRGNLVENSTGVGVARRRHRVSTLGLSNVSSQPEDETPKIAFSRPAEFI
ncbi:hypothetical protein FD724_01970 [Nostoc sp. C057]|uniref:hypothetical protein n=1 Tax=Nostoc sp. C057 TaxID=2576903 RepID=UPI0015C3F95E|nr:hypothetical protein [Nostoc sp. C057]QLE47028.1 hypothetical protein FD724_01970 [Nostoc sp. C057]